MSQTLASMQTFTLTADQVREHVKRDGTKTEERFTRQTVIQWPNKLTFRDSGGRPTMP
jgi:hypothetical protein